MQLSEQEKSVTRVLRALESIKNHGMVIMIDEEDRENEGDIVFAAEHVSPDKINFMAREARGLICLALEPELIDRLKLPMMRDEGKSSCSRQTAFTVSIEAREGVTTGISARDRAHTIRVAVDENSSPDDLVVPGHIFPLRARSGGILERAGHTEGSVDLIKLAGFKGGAVICEIMNEDGTMSRMPDLEKLSHRFELPLVSIPDLISYRLLQESLVELEEKTQLQTKYGLFDAYVFRSKLDGCFHLALTKGKDFSEATVDVRVHIQRAFSDVFAHKFEEGLKLIAESKAGVFVYLGRNFDQDAQKQDLIDLFGKLPGGSVSIPTMDQRQIGTGAQILRNLGIKKMRIFARSEKSYIGLSGFGLEVVDTVIIS